MASNMYIQFFGPDVNGGTGTKGFEGQSDILSFEHSFIQPTTPTRNHAGAATFEKSHHNPFTFTKILDSATDDLLKACWTGKHFDSVKVTLNLDDGTPGTGTPYLMMEFDSVVVTSYHITSVERDLPHETIALNYGKVTYTYTTRDKSKGTMGAPSPVSHDLRDGLTA